MKKWNFREIIEILEVARYQPQSYTGRNMYQKVCVAVQCDSKPEEVPMNVVKTFVNAALESSPKELSRQAPRFLEETSLLIERLQGPCVDRLGQGYIIYWPGIDWEEESEQAGPVDVEEDGEYEKTEEIQVNLPVQSRRSVRSMRVTLPSNVDTSVQEKKS